MLSQDLKTYLVVAALLLIIGVYGVVQRRSFIGMLISAELILAGAGLNFMAFNRFMAPAPAVGQVFTLIIMGIAAAETAIGVSFILAVYRQFKTIDPIQLNELRESIPGQASALDDDENVMTGPEAGNRKI
jgi:NADH:ubiquinone oxidoreductase subunit K